VSPVVRRRGLWNASGSFTVSTSGCRACTETCRLPSARRGAQRAGMYRGRGPARARGAAYAAAKGDVLLCRRLSELYVPAQGAVKVLEIGIPL